MDALRGLALLGVLLVNLDSDFRVSLADQVLHFQPESGILNRWAQILLLALLEFKAIALFSFLFGAGVAIQAERVSARDLAASGFLARRFLVLLAIGLCHMLLIWNGDILTLYAVCGLVSIPFLRLGTRSLFLLGLFSVALPVLVPVPFPFPSQEVLGSLAAEANRVYSTGSLLDVLGFRLRETPQLIVPLLLAVMPQTLGLLFLGVAAARTGLFREPRRHRTALSVVAVAGFLVGGVVTGLKVYSRFTGAKFPIPSLVSDLGSHLPLAAAYGAAVLLWLSPTGRLTGMLAAAGRMALTNYLVQSVVLSVLFHGYGFGLFGRLGSAPAACIGLALYVTQLWLSRMWLRRYQFGPVEWVWRSLTYGRAQPMVRAAAA